VASGSAAAAMPALSAKRRDLGGVAVGSVIRFLLHFLFSAAPEARCIFRLSVTRNKMD
jgi:hypothetical protein